MLNIKYPVLPWWIPMKKWLKPLVSPQGKQHRPQCQTKLPQGTGWAAPAWHWRFLTRVTATRIVTITTISTLSIFIMIDYDWLWLIMIDYDWLWLIIMIDYDWLWLIVIDYDWLYGERGFLSHRGTPKPSMYRLGFSTINQPAIEVPPFMKTSIIKWCKQCHVYNPPSHHVYHHSYRWYVYKSQSWVVYDIVLPTLY